MANALDASAKTSVPHLSDLLGSPLSLRAPILIGGAAIALLFLVLILWSTLAPLASATLAVGTVVVESNRKVVQHLEGGIIRKVSVNDGDHVSLGDTLIQLDETRLISAIQTLKPLLAINIAQMARLEAERANAKVITFPTSQDGLVLSEFQAIKDNQSSNFMARSLALAVRVRALELERRQLQATLAGLQQQIEISDLRLGLVTQDLSVAAQLASNGAGTQQRLRDVAKIVAELKGERTGLSTRVTEADLKIERTNIEIEHIHISFIESVESDIQQNDRDHLELLDKYRNASDQLRRTRIEAPVAGKIVNLVVHTVGGIVSPGMALLEIVPDDDRLLIEAQIKPVDVEAVTPGLPVRIRVNGSDSRRLPFLTGLVLSVSADRILDRQRSSPYFLVRIELPQDQLKRFKQENLKPGMGVEIMITRGEKTVIEYLISPILSSFANAMHE